MTPNQCEEWFVDLVNDLSNQPAYIEVDEYPATEEGSDSPQEKLVTIQVGDQLIGTMCTASACGTADPETIDWAAYEAQPAAVPTQSSKATTTMAIVPLVLSVPDTRPHLRPAGGS